MGTQENVQRKVQTLCPVADTTPQFVVPSATVLTGQGFSPSVFCFRIKRKQNPALPSRRLAASATGGARKPNPSEGAKAPRHICAPLHTPRSTLTTNH